MMKLNSKHICILLLLAGSVFTGCKVPELVQDQKLASMPERYSPEADTVSSAEIKWRNFFSDPQLVSFIDTALKNNPDLLKTWQEIEIAQNNVGIRKSLLFPTVTANAAAGVEKVGRYTSQGAGDASTEMTPGKGVPEILPDYFIGLQASWEADIWGKLHNARRAALTRYLGTVQGRNYVVTNLVAEVANTYYELLSLDNQLEIIRQTITLQKDALDVIKVMKQAAVVTELGVKQFEAQVYNSQGLEYEVLQQITENENRLNFLLGRYPQPIPRNSSGFKDLIPTQVRLGIPSQLLRNRPDVKQAELELYATKLDVQIARAEFYPSLSISGLLGFQAFKGSFLFTTPQSLAFSAIGDLAAPLINRAAIKAEFNKAKAYQLEAVYDYQKTILTGYNEVSNEMSNIRNLEKLYEVKSKQASTLTNSIDIANDLLKAARANYLEVLMTQRDALETRLQLMEVKKRQLNAVTNIYKALGGGWN